MAKSKKITEIINLDSVEHAPIKRGVTSFLDTEVKDCALYVVSTRACPNIMDGLRTGARKILWSAMTGSLKSGKKDKMVSLIGESSAMGFNHGDSSLKGTIEQLGAKHVFEFAPFNIIGQTADLRVTDVDTAPRYLKTQLNDKNIKLFKYDLELLDNSIEDGHKYEPKYMLPIVPMSLLIRTNSPGFGFSYRSFSHNLDDIINATLIALTSGTCNGVVIRPRILGVSDEKIIYNSAVGSYYNVGDYTIEKNILTITDLPYNISLKKYELHLKKLVEDNILLSYKNLTKDGKIKFVCIFLSDSKLNSLYSRKWDFYRIMLLYTKIMKDTFNLMDTNGRTIINFKNSNDLVDGFVKRRVVFYDKRKVVLVSKLNERIAMLKDRVKFIQLILDDVLIINKRKIDDIKKDCVKFGVSHDGLQLAISRLTVEEIEKSLVEIDECEKLLVYTQTTSAKEMYVNDLMELKEEFVEPIIDMRNVR